MKESETIEFKKSTAEVKSGVVSIAAMLNKYGRGEVYFGIADDGKVLGQTIGRTTIKDVTQAVVDNTEPKIYPKVEVRQIEGKDCIVVEAHGIRSLSRGHRLKILIPRQCGNFNSWLKARRCRRSFSN